MKMNIFALILFVACQAAFAQGISVQGIARNAEKAALVNQLMTFTFEIQDADANTYYKETVEITTDLFGVFSHIIGTGTKQAGGNFNEIPFSQKHMKLVITANGVVISNAPFQYAPYAKSAENGVPTGTIVAFAGAEANVPAGWVLCDGRALSGVAGSKNLVDLIGPNAPNLKGMFLRGTGTTATGEQGPALGTIQPYAVQSHNHPHDLSISSGGAHTHGYNDYHINDDVGGGPYGGLDGTAEQNQSRTTTSSGAHTHEIQGGVLNFGDNETRPINYGVNYIIKL